MTSESDPAPTKTHFKRKPARCPNCRHVPVASIQYGFPNLNDEMQRKIDAGRVAFGGCTMDSDNPEWSCSQCDWKGWRVYPDIETLNDFNQDNQS